MKTDTLLHRFLIIKSAKSIEPSKWPDLGNHSETSSLLSHRFSTISISSNVSSSDISFGNTSGSSCYLASMSSADFDDSAVGGIPGGSSVGGRFGLTSSFSLSEADEAEYLAEQEQQQQQQTSTESSQQTPAPIPPATSTNVVPTVQQKQKSFQVQTTWYHYELL